MDALKLWLDAQIVERKAEPNGRLGKAIIYLQKRWQQLTLFLRRPGAPLDNNLCYAARGITQAMPRARLCRVASCGPLAAGTAVFSDAA